MRWKELCRDFEQELKVGSPESPATGLFDQSEDGIKRWKDLKVRVSEHVSILYGWFCIVDNNILHHFWIDPSFSVRFDLIRTQHHHSFCIYSTDI